MKTLSGTSPTKTRRYTRDEMGTLTTVIVEELALRNPMTLRQLYYRLVSLKAIDKTEAEYKRLSRLTVSMRREGRLPWQHLTDTTRWMRKPMTWDSISDVLEHTAHTYRRSLWASQPAYVEIWMEKDALTGIAYPITSRYDVPLMVSRGFNSWSFIFATASNIKDMVTRGKKVFLYYLGDYDPSGAAIDRALERSLREVCGDVPFEFLRLGVKREQILQYDLPTRPTKKSDSRASKFGDDRSVELDAIPVEQFQGLIEQAICQHIDTRALTVTNAAEDSERDYLHGIVKRFKMGVDQ